MTHLDTPETKQDDFDCVSALMHFEADELDEAETIRLFQYLLDTCLAWKLQGHYGRSAQALLDGGKIRLPENRSVAERATADHPRIKSRFPLGQTVVTTRAIDLLRPDEIALGLARHVRGDWGNLCPEDAQTNEEALRTEGRLVSVYGHRDRRFWIITEWDRSVTTILLPEDY
jgi:hypothetical protein